MKTGWFVASVKGVREIADSFAKHGGALLAAAISFYVILSIVPFLLVFTSIVAHVMGSSQKALEQILTLVAKILPASGDAAIRYINALIGKRLTFGIVGGIMFYWSGSAAFQTAIASVDRIYGAKGKRFFLQQKVFSFAIVPLILVTFALFVGLSRAFLFLNNLVKTARLGLAVTPVFSVAHNILPTIIAIGFFFTVYRTFSYRNTNSKAAASGAAFAAVFTTIAKYLYDWFVKNLSQLGRIYGGLSAVIVVLLWIYYVSLIFIVGAEVTAFVYRMRRRNPKSG